MKTILLRAGLVAVAVLGSGAASAPAAPASAGSQADLVLRCQFAGLQRLLADTGAPKLAKVWALAESEGVKKQALDQLARVPFQALGNQLSRGASDQFALFRPLLDDVLRDESYLDWSGPAGRETEFVLCAKLSDERAKAWGKSLKDALEAWKLGSISPLQREGTDGWILQHKNGTSAFAFTRAGQWVVLGLGPRALPVQERLVRRIKAEGRPAASMGGHWLVADASLDRLKPWLPPLAPYAHPALAHIAFSNSADNVRSSVTFTFAQPEKWQIEPWSIPTNLIRDPLISFGAVRGIAPLLKPLKTIQEMAFSTVPNQASFWANESMPFMSQWAIPAKDAGKQLTRIAPKLGSTITNNPSTKLVGVVGWDTNHTALSWRGLPIAVPEMRAAKIRDAEFLYGTMFPAMASTNLAPKDLLGQLGNRDNLLYYQWEITEARLRQWRPLFQLLDIASGRVLVLSNAPTQKWLVAAAPLLGNSITEITAASPTELKLVRKSHCGFTGFELVSFARWLDSPDFPRLSFMGKSKGKPVVRPKDPKPGKK